MIHLDQSEDQRDAGDPYNGQYRFGRIVDQNRAHNQANEITDITETVGPSWITPVHDAVGNMTTIPQPASPTNSFTCKWDAWNRLVQINSGSVSVYTPYYQPKTNVYPDLEETTHIRPTITKR